MARGGFLKFVLIILAIIAFIYFVMPDTYNSGRDSISTFLFGEGTENSTDKKPASNWNSSVNRTPPSSPSKPSPSNLSNQEFTIANWNLQIFGPTKSSNITLLRQYRDIIEDYDIIFIQEIRDSSELAFPRLCVLLDGYSCEISSRAGRTSSKEQYGIIYKDEFEIISIQDFNPDKIDRWERPPIKVEFNHSGYVWFSYNIHTKPDDVPNEMMHLESVVNSEEGNVMVLGDLNADCSYYSRLYDADFVGWDWLISDIERTNMGRIACAYDRIIVNDDMSEDIIASGIRTKDITEDLSDHYLVWTRVNSSITS